MYSLAINITSLFLRIIALWNRKMRLFVDGRKGLFTRLEKAVSGYQDIIWFHTASMGEFEEARPIIEAVRRKYPERKILLTFFSPSGYEPRKNWEVVDWVFYLPLDTRRNARRFVEIVRPSKAVFTIGEFWYNFLYQLKDHQVDTYIMSVLVNRKAPYMKWYGGFQRKLLREVYKKIMVKNQETREVFESFGCTHVLVTGDARFDRVRKIADEPWQDEIVENWLEGRKAVIGGSTCEKDDDLLLSLLDSYPDEKFLFIPHELEEEPIRHILDSSPHGAVLYSEVERKFPQKTDPAAGQSLASAQVLVVDKIGMLSRLYRYGWCALIGGGFINVPHSVIEASVYGLPVVMGPHYHKNLQFVELMASGAAVPVNGNRDMAEWFRRLHDDQEYLAEVSRFAAGYCRQNCGATAAIMDVLFT